MVEQMFLLDTNIISNSSKKRPHPRISAWLIAQKRVAIPFAALLEIETGIAQRARENQNAASELWRWLDSITETAFEYPIATPEVARVLGHMLCCRPLTNLWFKDAEHDKRKPGQDLFIAATAIVYHLPIATTDGTDFELINRYYPLPGVFNPAFNVWVVARSSRLARPMSQTTKEAEVGCIYRDG
jgi:predicted nucleic acid-binding protein